MPAACNASAPGITVPRNSASPSPISGSASADSGARSPTLIDPMCGTTGCTRALSIDTIASNTAGEMPEPPLRIPAMRANSIARTTSVGNGLPTPTLRARIALS